MKNRILITMIIIMITSSGCTTSRIELHQEVMNNNESIVEVAPQGFSPSDINNLVEEVDSEVNHVSATSSDGIYRIETFGVNKEITAGGLYPVEGIRLVDTASEQVQWLNTPGYYNNSFLWSADDRYVAVNFESRISGGTYILDTQNMTEIALPYVEQLQQNWVTDTTINEARSDPYFFVVEWLNSSQVSVSFQWTGLEDKLYSGTYSYDVVEGKLLDLKMDEFDNNN
ncbi:hypothetical protein [Paenibacillus endoradicis]|uniref:hypothetical protein n=1 Tax=Paenibacillus endoradicis TaxID=2972487 RepID=UPI002159A7B9|nr:hypothetical protein [Paenibacillus endoradicis]MCR8656661.1 hypothetical protein [Paenibacillus endoradicis]